MAVKKGACAKLYKMHFNGLAEADGKTLLNSFQILPVSSDCPIEGAIYDPTNKVLVIKTKVNQEETLMLPKLNELGGTIPARIQGQNGIKQERVRLLGVLENRIFVREEIIDYVKTLCETDQFVDGVKLEDLLNKLDNYSIITNK